METQYTLIAGAVSALEKKVEQLNRKAERFGWPLTEIEIVGEEWIGDPDFVTPIKCVTVQLTHAPMRLDGWRFVASLEPGRFGNTVRAISDDVDIPVRFRTSGMVCDHCELPRPRNAVFVLAHEDGRMVQVGRTCLRDFTGHDIEGYAAMLEGLMGLQAWIDLAESDFREGRARIDTFEAQSVMALACRVVREWGWISKRAAIEKGDEGLATVEQVREQLTLNPAYKRDRDRVLTVEDRDREKGAEVLEWMRSLAERDNLSTYEWNLVNVASQETVSFREVGILASGIAAYDRERERRLAAERKAGESASNYVGEVGERLTLNNLKVKLVRQFNGAWGVSTLYIFEDSDGNLFAWWASREQDFGEGDTVSGKATVKKHDLSKYGEKQTRITRCTFKVVEPEPVQMADRQYNVEEDGDILFA